MWVEKDIHFCEACPILHDMGLLEWQCMFSNTNAHRHPRVWYRKHPELLYDFSQVIRACMMAHPFLDAHPEIKEEVFKRARG